MLSQKAEYVRVCMLDTLRQACEAAELLSQNAEAASASAAHAMHDTAASNLLAWEAFAATIAMARKAQEMVEKVKLAQVAC